MTTSADKLATASKTVQRQASYHWELNHVVLDLVFSARDTLHMQEMLGDKLYSDPGFQKLPLYRQLAIDSYLAGVLDGLARTTLGAVARPDRPKSVPPKKGKNKQKSVPPKLYPSNGSVYPIPQYINPGPQAYLHAPPVPTV